MADHSSLSDVPIVSHDAVRQAVQMFLRGAQARMTDDMLEAASGIKARTIKSYRLGDAVPSLEKALSLACVIGPTAINPLLALIGYVARPLDEADDIAPVMIVANGMRHMATIAAAAADGRIDHTEERDCQKAADAIIEAVLPLSSAGRAQ